MMKRLLRLLRTASLALLFAGTASAQTTGKIIGVVTDFSTGKPVAGALVVATSPNLQGEQTAVSDAQGNFRFEVMPVGQYKLTAQLDTYKPFERTDIVVRVDKTIRANLSLTPEAVQLEEQVVKTGIAPVINVGSAETGAVVSKEFIASVPVGRDFSATAIVAPGARTDLYGVSFNGSSSPENGYVLDGMNIADPAYGTIGSTVLNNFVEQIDIKTSAFMPEYGRSSGGMMSVVTKSGSNEFHGSVWGNYQPGSLSPEAREVTRNATSIAVRRATSREYQTDFGAEVGGPVMKDKLWFYAGVAPVLNHQVRERYLQALQDDGTGHPVVNENGLTAATPIPGTSRFYGGDRNQYQFTGKLTYLLNSDNSIIASIFAGPGSDTNLLLRSQATDSASLFNSTTNQIDANARWSGKFMERRLIVEGVAGWHHQLYRDDPVTIDGVDQATTSAVRWDLPHSITEFYDASQLPTECNPTATFTPCPVQNFTTGGMGFRERYNLDRVSGKLSGSYHLTAAGQHTVKGGIDIERSYYDHWATYTGGIFLRERNTSLFGPVFQDYRSFGYVVPGTENADVSPARGARAVTSVTDSRAYYLQDSWQVIDKLTVNGGLRWETQSMFKEGENRANLVINDNIAPRLQAIYDFTGQGRSKVSAHWGRYYEAIPLDMGDRSFGGETQVQATRAHCVAASSGVAGSPANCPVIPQGTYNAANGQYVTWAPYGGSGAVAVAPDLKGQYTDQFGVSAEYEFLPDFSIGLEYRGSRLGRVIEDMSSNDGTDFFIANPGTGNSFQITGYNGQPVTADPRTATAIDMQTLRPYQIAFPKPQREYDGFTVELRKNFSSHWLASASYTYSVLRGNYGGLFRGEDGQLDPNITSEYDLAQLMSNHYGPLPADTPHQFKLFGSYAYDFSSKLSGSLGGALRAQSGQPITYLGSHPWYGDGQTFIMPRGTGGRTPAITNVDLKAQMRYVVRAPYAISFSVDVFNLLNSQEATAVDQNYTFDDVLPISNGSCSNNNGAEGANPVTGAVADCPALASLRTVDGRAVTVNRNFGRATSYQAPLSIRFGLALAF